jgi:NAD(P)-dependent dehydrogenase (short-subunit alcohol dehydrogenase family)
MRTGRSVVVTGGAGGIGSAVVSRFLGNGDDVLAVDLDETALERLAAGAGSGALRTQVLDVADGEACRALAAQVEQDRGRVDVLVNVAGYFPVAPYLETTKQLWDRVIAVNLTGVHQVIQSFLPLMTGRGWGRIVSFGSASTYDGVAEQAPYVAAKAGVVGLSRSLARAVGGDGITVNVVAPGLTETPPVTSTMPAEMLESQPAVRAIPRAECAEDLVGATFFLASPDADFMSGQTLVVDGGKHFL